MRGLYRRHAGCRGGVDVDRLRRFQARLSDRGPLGRARTARSLQRQVLCAVLYDQAGRGGVQDFDAIKLLKMAVS